MLALKNWDTNLRASEKKTLGSFLLLYAFLMLLILVCVAIFYYVSQRELLLQEKREMLATFANEHIAKLKNVHANFDKEREYPRDERYESAIYDSSLKEIFSTLTSKNVNLYEDIYLKNGHIYFIKELEFYYLGARYIALEIPAPYAWDNHVYQELVVYGLIVFGILVLIGYFLLSLLLQPMRQAIDLLDRFIKDTTHELNTPVNAILSNIEMIELNDLDPALSKKMRRIAIASKTISNLYDDLTYLVLSHNLLSHDESISIKELVEERLEYFLLPMESKKITLHKVMCDEEVFLMMDRKKMAKVIDNILSNAIKYNTMGGSITVTLEPHALSIRDTGQGMDPKNVARIFERYTRFDTSVGGFGIGLSIVALIAKEYRLGIDVSSVLKEGTCVRVTW